MRVRALLALMALLFGACSSDEPEKTCGDASSCPAGMVRVAASCGAFCMDGTEVTRNEYATFLAQGPDPAGQPDACSWNTSFEPACPTGPAPGSDPQLPVTCVDWCDARAYCSSVSKRLCTGLNHSDEAGQWSVACSLVFGASGSSAKTCNNQPGELKPVGTSAGCHGDAPPLDGLKDLIGNATEWTDDCAPIEGVVYCLAPGDSGLDGSASCGSAAGHEATLRDPFVGFRCCAL